MSERQLVSIRREVPADRSAHYAQAWRRIEEAADTLAAHAWRFRSATRQDAYIEFLEFERGADPRESEAFAEALHAADAEFAPLAVEEWIGG